MTFQSIEPKHIGGWLNLINIRWCLPEEKHDILHHMSPQYLINSEGTIFQQYSIYLTNIYMHHVRPWETLTPPTILSRIKIQRKMGCLKDPGPGRFLFLEHMGEVPMNLLSGAKSHHQQYGQSTIEQWFNGKKGNKNMKSIETRLNSIV